MPKERLKNNRNSSGQIRTDTDRQEGEIMNRLERKAALAVAAAAAGVVVSGVSLLKKHTKYMTKKAASTFDPEEDEDWFDEAESFSEAEGSGESAGESQNGETAQDTEGKEAAAEAGRTEEPETAASADKAEDSEAAANAGKTVDEEGAGS